MNLNKLVAFFVGISLALSVVTTYKMYKLIRVGDRDIQKLDKKFGTPPSDPSLFPVVHLATTDGRPFCTAFVIDANYAATAGHCVEDGGKLKKGKMKFLDENNVDLNTEVTPVGYDEGTDFGLLQGNFNKFYPQPSNFTDQGFIPGAMYAACGYPFGQKHMACNPIQVINNNHLPIRVLGFLRNGMSGGPVVNEKNIAVGINFAITDGYSYVNSLQGYLGVFKID